MAEVATNKVFENSKMIAWELILDPGESSGIHSHAHDYFFYVIEASELEAFDAEGSSLGKFADPVGGTVFVEFDGTDLVHELGKFPATHEVRNIGQSRYREVLIELK